jgi:hypothetical protein
MIIRCFIRMKFYFLENSFKSKLIKVFLREISLFLSFEKQTIESIEYLIKNNKILRLKPEDLKDNTLIKLRFVKFQNVQSITVN